jgi:hypothetical protein
MGKSVRIVKAAGYSARRVGAWKSTYRPNETMHSGVCRLAQWPNPQHRARMLREPQAQQRGWKNRKTYCNEDQGSRWPRASEEDIDKMELYSARRNMTNAEGTYCE